MREATINNNSNERGKGREQWTSKGQGKSADKEGERRVREEFGEKDCHWSTLGPKNERVGRNNCMDWVKKLQCLKGTEHSECDFWLLRSS